ncbi:hypothetical protein HaLaN_32802, partial [Haematococcus lacustris]
ARRRPRAWVIASSLHESLGKPKLLGYPTARLKVYRSMAKKLRKGTAKQKKGPATKLKASRSSQGKQRQDRGDGGNTKRRQAQGHRPAAGQGGACG